MPKKLPKMIPSKRDYPVAQASPMLPMSRGTPAEQAQMAKKSPRRAQKKG